MFVVRRRKQLNNSLNMRDIKVTNLHVSKIWKRAMLIYKKRKFILRVCAQKVGLHDKINYTKKASLIVKP